MENKNFKEPDYSNEELSRMVEGESYQVGDRVDVLGHGPGTIKRVQTPLSFFVKFDNGQEFLVGKNQLKIFRNEANVVKVGFKDIKDGTHG